MTAPYHEDEIVSIMTTWPEADRLAGVLRVVRAMQADFDSSTADLVSRQEDIADAARRELDALRSRLALAEQVFLVARAVLSKGHIIREHIAAYEAAKSSVGGASPIPASEVGAAAGPLPVAGANPAPPSPSPLLALADAAMPIIRHEGFVQFGPHCAIHADRIASPASPIIRNAFLTWMESVERYHAAKGEGGRLQQCGEDVPRDAGSVTIRPSPEPPNLPCECGHLGGDHTPVNPVTAHWACRVIGCVCVEWNPPQYKGAIPPRPAGKMDENDYVAGPLSDWNALPHTHIVRSCPHCHHEIHIEVETYPNKE